jgi:hypothetical protein
MLARGRQQTGTENGIMLRLWRPTFNHCTVRNIIMARFYLCENPRM